MLISFNFACSVDWDDRMEEIEEIANFGKNSSSGYDCIIGVSGGKDSTRQALFVKETLGMKPLLVSLSRPPQGKLPCEASIIFLTSFLWALTVLQLIPPLKHGKKLMRISFYEFGNPLNQQSWLYIAVFQD